MKKNYIKPTIETITFSAENNLMAASSPADLEIKGDYENNEVTPLSKPHKFDLWDMDE